MSIIRVHVLVGIGAWMAEAHVDLPAAPHVGDQIVVGDQVIHCERVRLFPDHIEVYEKIHFQSETSARNYF